jgi:5-methylcytosine-specific restriction endonuclease McrA
VNERDTKPATQPLDPSSDEAISPSGQHWWEPGATGFTGKRKLGVEPRTAAWLRFHVAVGETFTVSDIREGVGGNDGFLTDEHAQRRLRRLREYGWQFPSKKHARELGVEGYRLDKYGWWPGEGPKPRKNSVSAAVRRRVLERDGNRCQICGVGAGEPYPGEPETKAAMTVGHVRPNAFGGSSDESNLRAECSRCNEPARTATEPPQSLETVVALYQNLKTSEQSRISQWVAQGHRGRDRVDELYDRIRMLSPGDRDQVKQIMGIKD